MPEGIEIELYRRSAESVVGRTVTRVKADDDWYLKGATTAEELDEALVDAEVGAVRRIGKLLIMDFRRGPHLGLRFGMTGRLLVDGVSSIPYLEYSSQRNNPDWDRFQLDFAGGGALTIRDPRRLGGVELEPDESKLGPDVFTIKPKEMAQRVLVGDIAVKARLLDQSRVAGIGNLIADETLWRSGIDPARPAGSIVGNDAKRLLRHLRSTLADLTRGGGSHTGNLQPSRVRGGRCPKDGAELLRRQIGGRTTFSCPQHQH